MVFVVDKHRCIGRVRQAGVQGVLTGPKSGGRERLGVRPEGRARIDF